MWEICTLWKMCISDTSRIQLSLPLFTWFLLYFMLGMEDFRVIKLFPSCLEPQVLYTLRAAMYLTTTLSAFSAYLSSFCGSPFSCHHMHLPKGIPKLLDSHWVLSHLHFQQSKSFRQLRCLLSQHMRHHPSHGLCLPWLLLWEGQAPAFCCDQVDRLLVFCKETRVDA